jgi:hypothetical protein
MKGGLILTDTRLTGFTPMIEMIKNGKITLLTDMSKSGIIFKLVVSEEHSYYTNFNKNGAKITEFIIKLAIIRPSKIIYQLGLRSKKTETPENFLQEARTQQDIWIKTNQYGGEEFVPGIANFAFFDNDNSQILLDYMLSSFRYNEYSDDSNDESDDDSRDDNNIFMQLNRIITSNPESNIGVIVMDYVKSINLDNAEQRYFGKKILQSIYKNTIFNILRLYLFYGIINLDLTTNNILITLGANMKIYLIDFGKITNINEAGSDNFFNAEEKRLIKEQQEKYKQRIHSDKDKAQLVYSICNYISNLEKNFTQKINRESKKNNTYQMDWIENFFSLLETDKQTICSIIFDLLVSDIVRINHEEPRVTALVRDGSIINFDLSKPVLAYYVPIFPPLRHKGGKKMKKSRKTKRHKKMKKMKKFRKTRRTRRYKNLINI